MQGHTAFKLRDYFRYEPFYDIYMKRNQDEVFFNAYTDYRKYLHSLRIVWQRIKDECNAIGDYHTQEFSKPFESPLSQETILLMTRKDATLNVLELDFEIPGMNSKEEVESILELFCCLSFTAAGCIPRGGWVAA
jgi:hypothetical protein